MVAMTQFEQQPTQWYNMDIGIGSSINQGTLTPADHVNDQMTNSIINTARVHSTTPDPNPNNNTSSVETLVNSVQIIKASNVSNAVVGDTITYSIQVINEGQVTAENFVVTDPLTLDLVYANNLRLNGSPISGDITQGVNIGNVLPGQTITITFNAAVISIPNTLDQTIINQTTGSYVYRANPAEPPIQGVAISNRNRVKVFSPKLVLTKCVDKIAVVVGSTVTFTITATNEGNVALHNVFITDILSSELAFVQGSVMIDGLAVPNANILTGINLGSLAVNQMRTITFKATVLSSKITPIDNQALAEFTYNVPGRPVQVGHAESNVVEIYVFKAELVVTKTVDKQEANVGDILTYTVTLMNTGDVTNYKVLFTDAISPQSTLIPGSFRLNGKVVNSVDLSKGIVIGNIAPGQSVTITYQVKVKGSNCSGTIVNEAAATFEYGLPDGSGGTLIANNEAGSTIVSINISTFKQMSIESYLTLVDTKPDIEAIHTVTGTVDIHSYRVITTPQGMSTEGQMLTGYKLVIKGILTIVTEYTALAVDQSMHSAEYQIPFSTLIVLSPDYETGSKLDVRGLVENIYYHVVDIRTFFVNTTTLMNVKVMSCE